MAILRNDSVSAQFAKLSQIAPKKLNSTLNLWRKTFRKVDELNRSTGASDDRSDDDVQYQKKVRYGETTQVK